MLAGAENRANFVRAMVRNKNGKYNNIYNHIVWFNESESVQNREDNERTKEGHMNQFTVTICT